MFFKCRVESAHVVGHVFKKTFYNRLLGMVSMYALNHIVAEFEHVHYAGKDPSTCGYVMRSTHSLHCACELSKYVFGFIHWIQSICSRGDSVFQTKGYLSPK